MMYEQELTNMSAHIRYGFYVIREQVSETQWEWVIMDPSLTEVTRHENIGNAFMLAKAERKKRDGVAAMQEAQKLEEEAAK